MLALAASGFGTKIRNVFITRSKKDKREFVFAYFITRFFTSTRHLAVPALWRFRKERSEKEKKNNYLRCSTFGCFVPFDRAATINLRRVERSRDRKLGRPNVTRAWARYKSRVGCRVLGWLKKKLTLTIVTREFACENNVLLNIAKSVFPFGRKN